MDLRTGCASYPRLGHDETADVAVIGAGVARQLLICSPKPASTWWSSIDETSRAGTKVTSLSPLTRLDIDGAALAATLLRAYLKQIILDGVFHAHPHPGNVLLTDDGRIALIDLGMIGRISPTMQERLLKLLPAVTAARGDDAADITAAIGEKLPEFDEAAFRRDIAVMVSRYGHESLANLQVGRVFLELQHACAKHRLRALRRADDARQDPAQPRSSRARSTPTWTSTRRYATMPRS